MRLQNCLIDLHVHLDGSLSIDTARALAEMQGISVGEDAAVKNRLQSSPACRDLNEYLEKFEFPLSLLQIPEALATCVTRVLSEQAQQGLIYSEIRFAPQLHTRRGMTQKEAVEAAIRGLRTFFSLQAKAGHMIEAGMILCCMRGPGNEEANLETVRLAKQYLGKGVVAADLAGAEALFPTSDYQKIFTYARTTGVPFTIHAGEAAGPESIRCAVQFGAARIGHGVRAVEDPALMQLLARQGICLELCPTSNLNTKAVPDMTAYPIRKLLNAGICVTVNTDNMSVSNTTVAKELLQLQAVFGITDAQVRQLLLNAANAAFAAESTKRQLREKIGEQYALYCN